MSDNGKFLLGLIAGLGLGTALGVLMAPDKGSNTYKKLEDAMKNATKDLQDYSNEKLKQLKKASK
ncbi:MAG: YtxH domain-containing protein [Fulvivirga sp.]|nr:YtxH domain-containing protein [Fulvivirga sp.]